MSPLQAWVCRILAGFTIVSAALVPVACDRSDDRAAASLRSDANPAKARRHVPAMAGGIQVNEPDLAAWTRAVRAAGLDSVQVTLYARQLAWDSPEMTFPDEAPGVVAEIRAAHEAGLRVILVMRTALEHALPENRHLWHGMIWPVDDEAVEAWFDRYREFVLGGADLAQREGVEAFAIGSEVNSLTSTIQIAEIPDHYAYFLDPERTLEVRERLVECATTVPAEWMEADLEYRDGSRYEDLDALLRAEEEAMRQWARVVTGWRDGGADLDALNHRRARYDRLWRDLIAETRRHYDGPLTYAANFDQVEQVAFWDALDAIGVNAYYSLSRWGQSGPERAQKLEESWREIAAELSSVGHAAAAPESEALPVLLLELGWTRKAGSTVRPFSYHRVEVLETTGVDTDGDIPLTCVHWATQPEEEEEREEALRALLHVAREGSFGSLRGFMLWKLTTLPRHREIEPFVVVLPGDDPPERGDSEFLEIAAELASLLRRKDRSD